MMTKVFSQGLANWQTWLFLYIILCVGSHMAPSMTDYQGGRKGGLILLLFFVIGAFLIGLFVPAEMSLAEATAPYLAPLLAVYGMVILLVTVASLVIVIFTGLWDFIPFAGP